MTNDATQEELLRGYVSGRATRARTMQCLGMTWYGELLALIEQCGMRFQKDPVRWDAMVNGITEVMRKGETKGVYIAIGDVGPLIHLVRNRSLDALFALGLNARVVVTDFALFEVERHSTRCDDAAGIREFMHSNADRVNVQITTTGSNHKALVVLAERAALNADLAASLASVRSDSTPDLGDLALIEVLRNLAGKQGNDLVLVLVEDDYFFREVVPVPHGVSVVATGAYLRAREYQIELLELQRLAEDTFNTIEDASEWLHRAHPMLEGESPLSWAKSSHGSERVKEILIALKFGRYV